MIDISLEYVCRTFNAIMFSNTKKKFFTLLLVTHQDSVVHVVDTLQAAVQVVETLAEISWRNYHDAVVARDTQGMEEGKEMKLLPLVGYRQDNLESDQLVSMTRG